MLIEAMNIRKSKGMTEAEFSGFIKRFNKAKEYKEEKDYLLSVTATYLIKKNFPAFTERDLIYNEKGKPYFKNGEYFSVSHSGDYAVIAKCESEIGIDIEKIKDKKVNPSERIFSLEEIEYIGATPERYYELWTKKESLCKCVGSGIIFPVKGLRVISSDYNNGFILYKGKKYYFKTFFHDSHVITVCSESKDVAIAELNVI